MNLHYCHCSVSHSCPIDRANHNSRCSEWTGFWDQSVCKVQDVHNWTYDTKKTSKDSTQERFLKFTFSIFPIDLMVFWCFRNNFYKCDGNPDLNRFRISQSFAWIAKCYLLNLNIAPSNFFFSSNLWLKPHSCCL